MIQTGQQARVLSVCLNRLNRDFGAAPTFKRGEEPTAGQLAILRERQIDLQRGMTPCAKREAAEVVLEMFDAWPNMRMDAPKARAVAVTYTAVLQRLPIWAIRAGARAAQHRNSAFPPSSGELLALCEDALASVVEEARNIEAVLAAEIVEPTRKGEAAKRNAIETAAKMGGSYARRSLRPDARDVNEQAAQHRLGEMRYADSAVEVSDELKQRIGAR